MGKANYCLTTKDNQPMAAKNKYIRFILSTAKDYDLEPSRVKQLYDCYFEEGSFYEKIEEEIKNREY